MGEAHSELSAWRHERGSCEIHCAWASHMVEAQVICSDWHLLSQAAPWHRQAAPPCHVFGAAEGEEPLDAAQPLD